MMKKIISVAMYVLLVLSLVACAGQNNEKTTDRVNTNETVNTEVKTDTNSNEGNLTDIAEDVTKQEIDLNLTEYQYSFEDQTVSISGDSILNESDFEELYENVTLTDSVELYIDADICIGYTKPNIAVSLMAKYGNWYMVSVGDKVRYAKIDEVDAAILKEAEKTETVANASNTKENTTTAPIGSDTPEANSAQNIETVPETPVQTNNKYTPDEAIAVYRSIMESGGITWNPGLKDVTSWGTGWIYLDKGQPEWTAETNLESFAIGNLGGDSWTEYYLEVTGSDENAVYITEWHD